MGICGRWKSGGTLAGEPVLAFASGLVVQIAAVFAPSASAAPGDLDPTFSGDGYVELGADSLGAIKVAEDGSILGVSRDLVVRYSSAGERDQSFVQNGVTQALSGTG